METTPRSPVPVRVPNPIIPTLPTIIGWTELPQVSILSRQNVVDFCRDIHMLVATNTCWSRQNTSFVATKVCLSHRDKHIFAETTKIMFVATNTCLS